MDRIQKIYNSVANYIKKNVIKPTYNWFNASGEKSDEIASLYSFEGKLDRENFFGIFAFLSIVFSAIRWFDIILITYLGGLFFFLCILSAIQKRCRDFGSKGTFWVMIVTIVMLLCSILNFMDIENADVLWKRLADVEIVLMLLPIILFFIPSKPEADENLRSPLLKYPLLYTSVCWVLAISLTLAVKHHFIP